VDTGAAKKVNKLLKETNPERKNNKPKRKKKKECRENVEQKSRLQGDLI